MIQCFGEKIAYNWTFRRRSYCSESIRKDSAQRNFSSRYSLATRQTDFTLATLVDNLDTSTLKLVWDCHLNLSSHFILFQQTVDL